MKSISYLFFCAAILYSCNQSISKKEPYNESRELVPNPEGYKKDSMIIAEPNTVTGTTKGDCDLSEYMSNPKTPKLAKAIFNKEDWNLTDFTVLSFLDSLTANNKLSRAFYFRVVTNTYAKSDGYYSESLGKKGKVYIENNTIEFLNYFVDSTCFTEQDLNIWVDIVMLEFRISAEKPDDKYLIDNYIKTLNAHCTSCNQKQRWILNTFCKNLLLK